MGFVDTFLMTGTYFGGRRKKIMVFPKIWFTVCDEVLGRFRDLHHGPDHRKTCALIAP